MSISLHYPLVTPVILQEVVRRILEVGSPIKIVLFGSQARGEAGPGSDLGVLIVEESSLPRYQRAPAYLRALVGTFPAKDVGCGLRKRLKRGRECQTLSSPPRCAKEKRSMPDKVDLARG